MIRRYRNSSRPSARLALLQVACAVAALAGCGGGGPGASATGTAPTAKAQAVLQTYITDNLATDYSKVWVSIRKITAVDAAGAEVTLLDATAAPVVVNLSSLASVGQFLSTVSLPAGVYGEVRVTLGNSVQLVSLDGATTIAAKLTATGTEFVVHVRNIDLDTAANGQLVLDFNLARFTYDPATGLVTPTIEAPKPGDAFGKFVRQQAEVHGTVKSVDTVAQTLVIDDARLGSGIVVSLAADAVILDETSSKTITLAGITIGARVEIKGVVTPGATTADPVAVKASVIHVEETSPQPGLVRVGGEGKVTSVSGSLITVALDEANFLPGANSVVVDVSMAEFEHGVLADLAAGVGIEFHGTLSGSGTAAQVLARSIDVRGAPSQPDRQKNPDQKFTAVNGAIATLNPDGTFTVTVTQADGPWVVPGPYIVDASKATYIEGNASCLAAGKIVQAVGSLMNTTLTAKYMKVKGCFGESHSEPPPPAPPPAASAPAPAASGTH